MDALVVIQRRPKWVVGVHFACLGKLRRSNSSCFVGSAHWSISGLVAQATGSSEMGGFPPCFSHHAFHAATSRPKFSPREPHQRNLRPKPCVPVVVIGKMNEFGHQTHVAEDSQGANGLAPIGIVLLDPFRGDFQHLGRPPLAARGRQSIDRHFPFLFVSAEELISHLSSQTAFSPGLRLCHHAVSKAGNVSSLQSRNARCTSVSLASRGKVYPGPMAPTLQTAVKRPLTDSELDRRFPRGPSAASLARWPR